MTDQQWIESHPYLEGVAALHALVAQAAAVATPVPLAREGIWEAAAVDVQAGVPLLCSRAAKLDVAPAGAEALRRVVARVAEGAVPPAIAASAKAIRTAFAEEPAVAEEVVRWLVRGAPEAGAPAEAGLLRFLGWAVLRRVLAQVVAGFDLERDGGRWRRGACPTCGSPPTMGALVPVADGRARHLACGCCGTRWGFQRVACPFCGNEEADRLALLEVQQEPTLRLEVCEECKGYLKTYTGDGDAELFLSDWSTLHLDVLARDRGFRRLGASLYDLGG